MGAVYLDPFLVAYAGRFQALAGLLTAANPSHIIGELRCMADELPRGIAVVDQLAVRSLFAQAVSRLVALNRLTERPAIAQSFIAFTAAGIPLEDWRHRLTRLLDESDATLRQRECAATAVVSFQVKRALAVIEVRHSDPDLGLEALAGEVGASPSHLSRLFTRQTGRGFRVHLHDRRVAAAVRLLTADDRLSVKEIAAAVGYRSVTELARHCKGLHGLSPRAIRHRALLADSVAS